MALPAITGPARVRVYLPSLDNLIEAWPEVSQMLRRATSRTGCEGIDQTGFNSFQPLATVLWQALRETTARIEALETR